MSSVDSSSKSNSKTTRGDVGIFNTLKQPKNISAQEHKQVQWKSLDELSNSSQYQEFVHREFPEQASELINDPISRRDFLTLMGGSIALAGVTGCDIIRRPKQEILTYNQQPESVIPGKPNYYTTSMSIGQEVTGLVVESHAGRPTKIEGLPTHNNSLGATKSFHQAEIHNLYSPDRYQHLTYKGSQKNWNTFWEHFEFSFNNYRQQKGKGFAVLSHYITSPTLHNLKKSFLEKFPLAKWYSYEAITQDNQEQALYDITGKALYTSYNFKKALRILSLDCDFLGTEVNSLSNTKDFVSLRNVDSKAKISRLYSIEADYSITGAKADHRFAVKPSDQEYILWLIADYLFNRIGTSLPKGVNSTFRNTIKLATQNFNSSQFKWLPIVCRDLVRHKGKSLVCVGQHHAPIQHALAHIINDTLENIGETVIYQKHSTAYFNNGINNKNQQLQKLISNINKNNVSTLIVIGTNPVHSAPLDLGFKATLKKIKQTIYLGTYKNETAELCQWILPQSHFLESWSDAISVTGTVNIVQPLIYPLYSSINALELFDQILGNNRKDQEIVKNYWKTQSNSADFNWKWKQWLSKGIVKQGQPRISSSFVTYSKVQKLLINHLEDLRNSHRNLVEIAFRPHRTQWDGRYADNAWLQELPDPMTRLTWDNAAIINSKMAKKYGLASNNFLDDNKGIDLGKNNFPIIRLGIGKQSIRIPIFVMPGISDNTVIVHMGYGREATGNVGKNTGFKISILQTLQNYSYNNSGYIALQKTSYPLACVQEHWSMEGRDLAKIEDLNHPPNHHKGHGAAPSLFKEQDYSKGMQWGMTIDLNQCTGCGGCVTACQAENNIPVVGKKQVILNREMHWIRMDRYFIGNEDNPQVVHQGVACQHCEMAPCETVCPVAATVHSKEGLNDMVYNRCIGTRYCSNNCPYKVRRFNFFNYTNEFEEVEKMKHNPDVTLRFRGVMEKCSYCVQRINESRIEYKNKGKEIIPDNTIQTACAQSCPADAIVFGNINDPNSRVSKIKESKRNYDLLAELNTRPRTSYLAKVLNPNLDIQALEKKKISTHA